MTSPVKRGCPWIKESIWRTLCKGEQVCVHFVVWCRSASLTLAPQFPAWTLLRWNYLTGWFTSTGSPGWAGGGGEGEGGMLSGLCPRVLQGRDILCRNHTNRRLILRRTKWAKDSEQQWALSRNISHILKVKENYDRLPNHLGISNYTGVFG